MAIYSCAYDSFKFEFISFVFYNVSIMQNTNNHITNHTKCTYSMVNGNYKIMEWEQKFCNTLNGKRNSVIP